MNIEGKVKIHNKHDIFVRSAETGELLQRGYAENIIVDRMYTRLCAYNTYFNNIVYGSGTTPPAPGKSTLGTRISYSAATQVSLVRALPTSVWVKSIRLGSQNDNGQYIREIGISDDSTQINTHALIVDSEGQPLEIYKTSDKIVDIYSTVYITLYDVDSGLFWYNYGLRDYLTGASMAGDTLGVAYVGQHVDGVTVSGTRESNSGEKWVKTKGLFTIEKFNKDIRMFYWQNVGLQCNVPRLGDYGFADYQRTDVPIGKGDGETKVFALPNKNIKDLFIKIDGSIASGWDSDLWTSIVFDTAPGNNLPITASYKCNYVPKDEEHESEIIFKIQYGASEPTPVMPPKENLPVSDLPGGIIPVGGDIVYGYFGEVSAEDLISGDDLCSQINLTAGISQYSDAGWLKCTNNKKIIFVAKKTIIHSISWNSINAVGAVFGEKIVTINGIQYKVRLLSTEEWDLIMYPIHKDHPNIAPNWENFGDTDIQVNYNVSGNGCYTWTSTPNGSDRVRRGYYGVTDSFSSTPSSASYNYGFRPVLEIL